MRVGLSVITHPGQSIWENGIGQNVFFLADLLSTLPFVESVILVDCGELGTTPGDAQSLAQRFALVALKDAESLIDVVIEIAGGIPVEWLRRFRARGGKAVCCLCGQPYSAMVETTIFDRPLYWADPERSDEVWILPKDEIFIPFLRSIHRTPVYSVPFLWAPDFLSAAAQEGAQFLNLEFGYRPGTLKQSGAARIAIFEPNISVCKSGFIPLLACDVAERANNGLIERVSLLNFAHLRDHQTFRFMLESTALHKAGKIDIYAREFFVRFMAKQANIVISHQLECRQNYLYLDTVQGDYPLLHNSPLFTDIGYYYPGSDIEAAARLLEQVCHNHDDELPAYRERNHRAIDRLSPRNTHNRDAYARRLIALGSAAGPVG